MTSRELLYVKTLAEEKSISKAAKKLFIAQPSLSQSLQKIETTLKTNLFNRTTSGLTLTYAGERYYQIACQILKIYDDFEAEISDMNELKTGRIQAGFTSQLGEIILPKILPEFKENCPNIELELTEDSTSSLENRLLSGELDFILTHAPMRNQNPLVQYEVLSKDSFIIALSSDHPLREKAVSLPGYPHPVLDLKLLKDESFLMLDSTQRIRHITDAILSKAKITPNVSLTMKNYVTLQSLAGLGIGITLLPNDYADLPVIENPPVFLSIPEEYEASWNLCIATLKDGYLSKAEQLFLSLIRRYFQH